MKKKVLAIIFILVAAICGVIVFMFIDKDKDIDKDELTTADEDVLIVTKSFPTKFIVYGDKIDFDERVNVEYVTDINDETLKLHEGYDYQMVIINDLTGNAGMTDEQWLMLYDKVANNMKYNCFYLGDSDFKQLEKLEIISGLSAYADGDLSVGLVHEGNTLITVFGTYVKDALYSMAEAVLHEMSYAIKVTQGDY